MSRFVFSLALIASLAASLPRLVEGQEIDSALYDKLLKPTPLAKIPLSPQPLGHPAPEDGTGKLLSHHQLSGLNELRIEQGWSTRMVHWRASNFWHRPLYFEDVLLERHGQTRGHLAQPLWSGAHFFGTLPALPYKMGLERPFDGVFSLGHGRPGNCNPPLKWRLPWEYDAALFEAGAIVGAIMLLP